MLKIRLRRQGSRNSPFYRVVLSDSRLTPRAATVEELGYYDPTKNPAVLSLKEERIDHWVSQGAQLSSTVAKLRTKSGQVEAVAEAPKPKAEKTEKAEAAPVEEPAAAEEAEAAAEETGEAVATEEAEPEASSEEASSGEEE